MSEAGLSTFRVRVGKRYTLTIPKEVREKLGVEEGDELELHVVDDGIILRKPRSLVDFIDSVKPLGSIQALLKEREEEASIEESRNEELTK